MGSLTSMYSDGWSPFHAVSLLEYIQHVLWNRVISLSTSVNTYTGTVRRCILHQTQNNHHRDIPLHPLHYAVTRGLRDSIILDLLEADPHAAACPFYNDSGEEVILLHHVLQFQAGQQSQSQLFSEQVTLAVLDAYPHAAKQLMGGNDEHPLMTMMWPLHAALQHGMSSKIIVALLVYHPEAARYKIHIPEGFCVLPFHLAQMLDYPEQAVVEPLFLHVLMGSNGEAGGDKCEDGFNLLHYALRHADVHDRIPDILNANPGAAVQPMTIESDISNMSLNVTIQGKKITLRLSEEVENVNGILPLHFAICQGKVPNHAMIALLRAFPQAAVQPVAIDVVEEDGHATAAQENKFLKLLPFHLSELLQSSCTTPEVVELLFQEVAVAAKEYDSKQDVNANFIVPLHYALEHNLSSLLLLDLLQYSHHQDAARERMPNGDMPLHCALRSTQCYSSQALLAIMQAYPEASMIRSLNVHACKRLPLHEAALGNTPPDVVEQLLQIYPNGLTMRDALGNTPADLVQPTLSATSIRLICQSSIMMDIANAEHPIMAVEGKDEAPSSIGDKEKVKDTKEESPCSAPVLSPQRTVGGFNFLALGKKMGLLGLEATAPSLKVKDVCSPELISEARDSSSDHDGAVESKKGVCYSSPKGVSDLALREEDTVKMQTLRLPDSHHDPAAVYSVIGERSEWTTL
jgi:ankyrin repeat protein